MINWHKSQKPARKQKRSTGGGQATGSGKTTGRDRRSNPSMGLADVYRTKHNEGSDRKHLTGREIERLIEATKGSRNEARDRCLLLLMFRHGFRVSEACRLKLDQVDTESRVLHVVRLKRGLSTTQPLRGDELRAIGAWLKERARMKPSGKPRQCLVRTSSGRCAPETKASPPQLSVL